MPIENENFDFPEEDKKKIRELQKQNLALIEENKLLKKNLALIEENTSLKQEQERWEIGKEKLKGEVIDLKNSTKPVKPKKEPRLIKTVPIEKPVKHALKTKDFVQNVNNGIHKTSEKLPVRIAKLIPIDAVPIEKENDNFYKIINHGAVERDATLPERFTKVPPIEKPKWNPLSPRITMGKMVVELPEFLSDKEFKEIKNVLKQTLATSLGCNPETWIRVTLDTRTSEATFELKINDPNSESGVQKVLKTENFVKNVNQAIKNVTHDLPERIAKVVPIEKPKCKPSPMRIVETGKMAVQLPVSLPDKQFKEIENVLQQTLATSLGCNLEQIQVTLDTRTSKATFEWRRTYDPNSEDMQKVLTTENFVKNVNKVIKNVTHAESIAKVVLIEKPVRPKYEPLQPVIIETGKMAVELPEFFSGKEFEEIKNVLKQTLATSLGCNPETWIRVTLDTRTSEATFELKINDPNSESGMQKILKTENFVQSVNKAIRSVTNDLPERIATVVPIEKPKSEPHMPIMIPV